MSTHVIQEESRDASATLGGKFLTFKLGAEEFGLEIVKVQEIIGLQNITALPMTKDYVRGVINLRGHIIPTIELRTRFQMESKEDTERTCIIVVEMGHAEKITQFGIIVDEVAEVLEIPSNCIQISDEISEGLRTEFLLGLGVIDEQVKLLLDIEKVITAKDIETLAKMSKEANQQN